MHCIVFAYSPYPRWQVAGTPFCGKENLLATQVLQLMTRQNGTQPAVLTLNRTVDFHTFLQWMCPTRKICGSWTCPSFLQASMFIVCDPSQPGARPRPSRDGWWWLPTSTYPGLPPSILNNFFSLSSLISVFVSNKFCHILYRSNL